MEGYRIVINGEEYAGANIDNLLAVVSRVLNRVARREVVIMIKSNDEDEWLEINTENYKEKIKECLENKKECQIKILTLSEAG